MTENGIKGRPGSSCGPLIGFLTMESIDNVHRVNGSIRITKELGAQRDEVLECRVGNVEDTRLQGQGEVMR